MLRVITTCALLLCFVASSALAAITEDALSSTTALASTTTHNHTVAANANLVLICVSIRETGGAVAALTSITVGGVSATLVTGAAQTNAGNVMRVELWQLLSPPTGVQSVVVTGNASTDSLVTGVISFKGAARASTFNTAGAAQATSTNADVASLASAVGEVGVLCGSARTGTTTVSADAGSPVSVERIETSNGDATHGQTGFVYTEAGAATSIDMRTDLSASVQWAAVAVSIRPLTRIPVPPILFQ